MIFENGKITDEILSQDFEILRILRILPACKNPYLPCEYRICGESETKRERERKKNIFAPIELPFEIKKREVYLRGRRVQ